MKREVSDGRDIRPLHVHIITNDNAALARGKLMVPLARVMLASVAAMAAPGVRVTGMKRHLPDGSRIEVLNADKTPVAKIFPSLRPVSEKKRGEQEFTRLAIPNPFLWVGVRDPQFSSFDETYGITPVGVLADYAGQRYRIQDYWTWLPRPELAVWEPDAPLLDGGDGYARDLIASSMWNPWYGLADDTGDPSIGREQKVPLLLIPVPGTMSDDDRLVRVDSFMDRGWTDKGAYMHNGYMRWETPGNRGYWHEDCVFSQWEAEVEYSTEDPIQYHYTQYTDVGVCSGGVPDPADVMDEATNEPLMWGPVFVVDPFEGNGGYEGSEIILPYDPGTVERSPPPLNYTRRTPMVYVGTESVRSDLESLVMVPWRPSEPHSGEYLIKTYGGIPGREYHVRVVSGAGAGQIVVDFSVTNDFLWPGSELEPNLQGIYERGYWSADTIAADAYGNVRLVTDDMPWPPIAL